MICVIFYAEITHYAEITQSAGANFAVISKKAPLGAGLIAYKIWNVAGPVCSYTPHNFTIALISSSVGEKLSQLGSVAQIA